MYDTKNTGIIVGLIILFLVVGFLYYKVNTGGLAPKTAEYYVPGSSLVATPYYSVPRTNSTATNRSYSSSYYSTPVSSSTAYSYYNVPGSTSYYYTQPTYYPPSNSYCYVASYDSYGNPMTVCQ